MLKTNKLFQVFIIIRFKTEIVININGKKYNKTIINKLLNNLIYFKAIKKLNFFMLAIKKVYSHL